jgi:hypothetical protein
MLDSCSTSISQSTSAASNSDTAGDNSVISHPYRAPAGHARTTPTSTTAHGETHDGGFSSTTFDQLQSHGCWSVEDLPYSSYLDSIKHAIPGVFDLVSIVKAARSQLKETGPTPKPPPYVTGEHMVVCEISAKDSDVLYWHDIDCANAHSLEHHSQILEGTGVPEDVAVRYILMDDFSARAMEVLGQNLSIDPSVFVKHLHESLECRPVENIEESSHRASPFPIRTINTPFTIRSACSHFEEEQTHMVVCPTDMHVVPTNDLPQRRIPIISSDSQERQLHRLPRCEALPFGESIHHQLVRRSFMRPSICEDFGPYLPVWPKPGDDATKYIPFQRITLDRSDHIIIHVPGQTEIPTGKRFL